MTTLLDVIVQTIAFFTPGVLITGIVCSPIIWSKRESFWSAFRVAWPALSGAVIYASLGMSLPLSAFAGKTMINVSVELFMLGATFVLCLVSFLFLSTEKRRQRWRIRAVIGAIAVTEAVVLFVRMPRLHE